MTNYYASQYGGMHMIWWVLWIIFLIWIFAIPYDIPGQRVKKDSPIDILKKRLASGEITNEEFSEKKKLMDS
jgi:putative membrane protein